MREIAEFCRNLKKDFTPKIKDPLKPVGFWTEKDVLNGEIVDAFVIILRTRGCSWALKSGCTMCGYFNDSLWMKPSDGDILNQFETAFEKYNEEPFVKIFNSGSFFDDMEIKPKVKSKILSILSEKADKISVESRPEYVTDETLKNAKKNVGSKRLEIGIGLETADDYVREYSINKGFTFENYKKSAEKIKKYNVDLKTYVLIKPPFLTEKESVEDSVNTVKKIRKITDTISFNPVNVQRNTLVEYLWKHKQYRPPWLWSIVKILKESKKIADDLFIKCDVSGGGNIRGAHNCRNCDGEVLNAISNFSLYQNEKVFKNLQCECYEKWLDQLELEKLGFGSLVDISRET